MSAATSRETFAIHTGRRSMTSSSSLAARSPFGLRAPIPPAPSQTSRSNSRAANWPRTPTASARRSSRQPTKASGRNRWVADPAGGEENRRGSGPLEEPAPARLAALRLGWRGLTPLMASLFAARFRVWREHRRCSAPVQEGAAAASRILGRKKRYLPDSWISSRRWVPPASTSARPSHPDSKLGSRRAAATICRTHTCRWHESSV